MSSIKDTATAFYNACESGKGWDGCGAHCHADATFSIQAGAFGDLKTVHEYTEALKGLFAGPFPGATYELQSCGVDDDRHTVSVFGVLKATHSADGGPVPPTGKQMDTEYVYVMKFDGDRIRHLTKVWNDGFAMRQVGWA